MTAAATATFRYTPAPASSGAAAGAAKVVTVHAPAFGNKDRTDPQQKIVRSRGGKTYAYNWGPRIRELDLAWDNLDAQERADLEDFFGEAYVDQGARWFYLTLVPTEREVLRAGATVGGAAVTAGSLYKAGQRVLMDAIAFVVRLVTPPFSWDEPGPADGLFSLSMTLEVMPDFLPDNA